jgi:hypothetical protein
MKRCMATALLLTFGLAGCYNTYQVPSGEFRKLQSRTALAQDAKLADTMKEEEMNRLQARGENDPVVVRTVDNSLIAVNRETRTYVRSAGGRRYPVTAFNFSMYSSQLVASDRDNLIPLADLKSYEVDLFSTGKTIGMVGIGVAAAVGFIAVLAATAGKKTFE